MRVKPRILSIVQNLPLPFGRRVSLECHALVSAGYRFAVIQPFLGVYQHLTGGPKSLDRTAEV